MNYTQQDIEDNMGLVFMVARRMTRLCEQGFMDFEDLISEGVLGLIHALDRFDPGRGLRFSSYAAKCIWGSILQGHRNLSTEHRKAQNSRQDVPSYTVSIFRRGLSEDEEIEYVAGLDDRGENAVSIEANANFSVIAKRLLSATIESREHKIIVERFGLDGRGERTLREIANELDLSQERVRQIQARVLKRAQKALLSQIQEDIVA